MNYSRTGYTYSEKFCIYYFSHFILYSWKENLGTKWVGGLHRQRTSDTQTFLTVTISQTVAAQSHPVKSKSNNLLLFAVDIMTK